MSAAAQKQACRSCPFREGAVLGYDTDAMEWLDRGEEPACHRLAGKMSIFANAPLTPEIDICRGFRLWESGAPGYRKPACSLT